MMGEVVARWLGLLLAMWVRHEPRAGSPGVWREALEFGAGLECVSYDGCATKCWSVASTRDVTPSERRDDG